MKIEYKKQCVALKLSLDMLTVWARVAWMKDRCTAAVPLPLELRLRLRLERWLLGANSCLTLALLRLASSMAYFHLTMASFNRVLVMSGNSRRWRAT